LFDRCKLQPSTQAHPRALPPCGNPAGNATGRGCLVGNPRGALRPPGGTFWVPKRTSRSPGVAFRHPRSAICVPAHAMDPQLLRVLQPLSGDLPRSQYHCWRRGSRRVRRSSWISSHPSSPSRRRSLPREGRMRIHVPSPTADPRSMRPLQPAGISHHANSPSPRLFTGRGSWRSHASRMG